MRKVLFLSVLFLAAALILMVYLIGGGLRLLILDDIVFFICIVAWNLLPVAICYSMYVTSRESLPADQLGSIGFLIFGVGLSVVFHLMFFYYPGDANGALIILFIPIYSTGLGFIGYFIGRIISKIYQRFKKLG